MVFTAHWLLFGIGVAYGPHGHCCYHYVTNSRPVSPARSEERSSCLGGPRLQLRLWIDPPGQCWEDFTHATDELVTVLEGEVEFVIEGKVHRPAIGEELLIPAGKVHSALLSWFTPTHVG